MLICVTGSAGFVGRHVVAKLLALGHEVVGVDSLDPQVHQQELTPQGYKFHINQVGYFRFNDGYDAIIHLAAQVGVGQSMYQPAHYVQENCHQTAMMLERLSRCKPGRLVVASSMSVYGEGLVSKHTNHGDPVEQIWPTPETHPPNPRSIYALTKYDQERLCLLWGEANKVPAVALRFFNIYGPGQALTNPYTGALAIFATRLLNGKAPVIYEDGLQTRDFVHVEDVADAVVHATTTEVESGVYNVGTGKPQTMLEVARALAEGLGVNIAPEVTHKYRVGDIRHCYADTSKMSRAGWTAKVDFKDSIKGYCKWLKEQPVPEDRFERAAQELQDAGLVR